MITTKLKQVTPTPTTPKYPYIGKSRSTGMVFLFSDEGTGTVLDSANNHSCKIGQHETGITEYLFTPYNGDVILRNS